MPKPISEQGTLRECIKWWLLPKPEGYRFTVAKACKDMGIASTAAMGLALPAFVGHLIKSVGLYKNAGETYRMLPEAERTPEHLLPR
jgi:hypothetical protein